MWKILKQFLFLLSPETAHSLVKGISLVLPKTLLAACTGISSEILKSRIGKIPLKNPIGLAAGFDKNANLLSLAQALGFGFSEIGSVSALPCAGHSKPRLFRLAKDRSLINWMGLPNDGAQAIQKRLLKTIENFPIGINLVKTPDFAQDKNKLNGIEDFLKSYEALATLGTYIVFNVSCPNTDDGKTFEEPQTFKTLAKEILAKRQKKNLEIPHYIKISPDLPKKTLWELVENAIRFGFDGFVIGNTTTARFPLKTRLSTEQKNHGGLSGAALSALADQQLQNVFKMVHKEKTLIAVGGILSLSDLLKRLSHGASLFQIYTGLVYNGPCFVKHLNQSLVKFCEQQGVKSYLELVGSP